ncbi:MAG: type IV pilus assembly protein PilM [Nitrospinae bacterium]|nr:type IV pilus assembly protein PilM [Nitrospinota bacterium]
MFKIRRYSPIGLEIDLTSIKLLQLRETSKGWRIQDMTIRDLPPVGVGDNEGEDEGIIQTIREMLKESSFHGKDVVSTIPPSRLDIIPIKIALSEGEDEEDAIIKEAKAHLSYKIDEAVIDYLPLGQNDQRRDGKERFLLIASKREDVERHIAIIKGGGLRPKAIEISACAVVRAMRHLHSVSMSPNSRENNKDGEKRIMVINMKDLDTSITVLGGNDILLERNIQWGIENMVGLLINNIELDRGRAKELLYKVGLNPTDLERPQAPSQAINARTNKFDDATHAKGDEGMEQMNKIADTVYEIVSPQLEDLCQEIKKVMIYFQAEMQGITIESIYIIGNGFYIKNMDKYIEHTTGITTSIVNPLAPFLNGEDSLREKTPYFSIALGLVLREIYSERF